MLYLELLEQLYALNKQHPVKLGLTTMHKLLAACHYPEKKFSSIHVAGTNGKGSVCTKIAKAYELMGKQVGLYTSPHLATFRERIQINSQLITEEEISEILTDLFTLSYSLKLPVTFFEITTVAAFIYFARQSVDLAVIETGLGGRLDATNVLCPVLTIITSISLDHTELLGNSIELITLEKAGIIKPTIPVIIGPQVPLDVIKPICHQKRSTLWQVSQNFSCFDEENSAVARLALKHLKLPTDLIEQALKVRPACRLQEYHLQAAHLPPKIILDVAHNEQGLKSLFQAIREKYPLEALHVICGLSASKDVARCLTVIGTQAQSLYLIEADNERAATLTSLSQLLTAQGFGHEPLEAFNQTLKTAFARAKAQEAVVVICGTFFIMAAVKSFMGIQEPSDTLPLSENFKN